jgi:hypothetical protein
MDSDKNIITSSYLQKTIFIVIVLLSIHFWGVKYIPQKFKIENFLVWIACGYCFFMVLNQKNLRFRNAILFFLFGLVLNTIPAFLHLGQSPLKTILSYEYYYFILIYFLLHYLKIDRKYVENTVIVFGIIYSVLFTIQYVIYPTEIFKNEVNTATEEIQLEILGHGFLMLAYFLALNRYLVNRRYIYLFLAIALFAVEVKCGFRSLVAGAFVVSGWMILRMFRLNVRDFAIVVFAIMVFIGLLQIKGVADTINGMINKSQNDYNLGTKYVRIVETEFFFKKYPQDLSYFIVGGGKPSGLNLWKYNPYAASGLNYNIVWVDIGLLGFYIIIGGIATLGLLWYTLKAVFIKLPRESFYLSSYFLYLFIVSFTNEEIYRNGIFTVHAIGLYLIDTVVYDQLHPAENLPSEEASLYINT